MDIARKNKIYAVTVSMLRTAALLCASGTLMQTFLSVLGFAERWIYLHSALLQGISMLTIFLGSRWADKGNVIRRSAFVHLPVAVLFLGYLPLCVQRSGSLAEFLPLLAIGIAQTVFTSLYTVCDYKLPYYVYKPEEYGPVTALCGTAASGISFGVGAAISALSAHMAYVDLMAIAFVVAAVLMGLSFVIQNKMRFLPELEAVKLKLSEEKEQKVPMKMVLTHPSFLKLLPANLLRGIASGTLSVLSVMALSLGFDETVVTALVPVQSVASVVGCLFFGFASSKMSPRLCIFGGSLFFLLLPLIMVPNRYAFLAVCAAVYFGRTLVDYAVPAALLRAVPVEIAGPYHAWRMIIHFAGSFVATTVAAFVPVWLFAVATVGMQMISGCMFLWSSVMRKMEEKKI